MIKRLAVRRLPLYAMRTPLSVIANRLVQIPVAGFAIKREELFVCAWDVVNVQRQHDDGGISNVGKRQIPFCHFGVVGGSDDHLDSRTDEPTEPTISDQTIFMTFHQPL